MTKARQMKKLFDNVKIDGLQSMLQKQTATR